MEDRLKVVDEKEAARLSGRAVQTLRNDRFYGRGIPYLKLGRSVRYQVGDINDFLDKLRVVPGGHL